MSPSSVVWVSIALRNVMKNYFRILLVVSSITGAAQCCGSAPAHAGQEIVLTSDQTQMLKLAEPPVTVIVGNPAIADVTTEGSTLYFHPRGYGLTNIIALDEKGRKLGSYLVRVIFEDSYSVSMYAPGGRETFSCRRDCEPSMRIGDRPEFFSLYSSQLSGKNSLARSQALGEDLLRPTSTTTSTTYANGQ